MDIPFIRGKGNEGAFFLASQIVTERAKEEANPLFIFGETGVGKTTLLHWIREHMQTGKAKIIDMNRFIEYLVSLLEICSLDDAIEVLLVDEDYGLYDAFLFDNVDIVLSGKEATQEAVLDVARWLLAADMQVVFISNNRMEEFVERMEHRFENMAVTRIAPLDDALKRELARYIMSQKGMCLEEETLEKIVQEARNGYEISGLLNKQEALKKWE